MRLDFLAYLRPIAFLILLCCLLQVAFSQTPVHRQYTAKEGLPGNTVYCVEQDSDGYIWFGTDDGVCRFNGQSFETFTTTDGLTDNDVLQIKEDSQGRIWMLTYNGLPCYFKNNQFVSGADLPLPPEFHPNHFLSGFLEDEQGTVYLSSLDGQIALIHPDNSYEIINTVTSEHKGGVAGMWLNRNHLFCGTRIFRITDLTTQKRYPALISVPDRLQTARYYFEENQLFGSRANRVLIFDQDYELLHQVTFATGTEVLYIGPGFYPSQIAIGTNKGLFFLDKSTYTLTDPLLKNEAVTYTIRDSHDGLWASTLNGGVFFIQNQRIRNYTESDLPVPIYTLRAHNNQLHWGGSNLEVGTINGDSIFQQNFRSNRELNPSSRILDIKVIDSDVYYRGEKLLIDRQGEVDLRRFAYMDAEQAPNGQWWVDNFTGIIPWDTYITVRDRPSSLSGFIQIPQHVRCLSFLSDSIVLCGTDDGMVRANTESRQAKLVFPETRKKRISGIIFIDKDRVLVSSEGWGTFLYNGNQLEAILNQQSGQHPDDIFRMRRDELGRIWLPSSSGVYVIENPSEPFTDWNWTVLNQSNGLLTNQTYDVAFLEDEVYVATSSGITALPFNDIFRKRSSPLVVLNQLESPDTTIALEADASITIPKSIQWTLRWETIYFTDRAFEFRYRMNAGEWKYTNEEEIRFYDLNPGSYTIDLSARTNASDWSAPQSYTMNIEVKWWKTSAAKSVLILLATASIGFLFYFRVVIIDKRLVALQLKKWMDQTSGKRFIEVKSGNQTNRILTRDILWIKSDSNYCHIHTPKGKVVVLYPLKSLEEQLASEVSFIRVHRSYLINLNYVSAAQSNEVVIGEQTIPVGVTYRKAYQSFYHSFKG